MISSDASEFPGSGAGYVAQDEAVQTTGRFIVTLRDDAETALAALQSAGVPEMARPEDYDNREIDMAEVDAAGGLYLPELGVAVVSADPTQVSSLRGAEAAGSGVLAVEPERIHTIRDGHEYVRGYRDGVADLASRVTGEPARPGGSSSAAQSPAFTDTAQWTWGLQATKVVTSPFSGAGIKVAVLDTGFTTAHPDFVGRNIVTSSFIQGETVEDGHGHGTHCVGTSCGPKSPVGVPRYGVAHKADILVGKVLSDGGSGSDAGILAGIAWALGQGADVISMSLGADVRAVSQAYEQVGRRALGRGALIVAAAGNNAKRPGDPGFVGIPANSSTIIAVGAVDSAGQIAWFSAQSNPVRGGQVDVAGPGVGVLSSWKAPERYRSINGTSMATPHAAGIAALWAEATRRRGWQLWATLAAESVRLGLPSLDVGGGLVSAPQ